MKIYVVLRWVFDLENGEIDFSYPYLATKSIKVAKDMSEKEDEYIGNNRWVKYTYKEMILD